MKKLFLAFLATGVVQIASFTSGIILARMLEAASRGEFAQIIAWFGFLGSIMAFGVNDSVTYYRSRNKDEGEEALSAALILSVPLSAIGALLCLGAILIVFTGWSAPSIGAAWLFLLFSPLYQWQQIFNSYYQSGRNAAVWTLVRVIPAVAYIVGLVLTVQLGVADTFHFIAANVAGLVLMIAVSGTIFWLSGDRLKRPSSDMVGRVFRFGFPTVVQRIASNCRDNFDRMVLPFIITNAALGHYVVASSTAYLIYIAGMTVDLVGFPAMSRAADDDARRRIAEFLISITFCTLVVLVIVLALVCEPVVLFLFGKEYESSISLVPWFLVAGAAQALRIVIGGAFKSFNLSRSMARFELVGAAIMVAILLGTSSRLGVYAGVLAHMVSALVSLGMAFTTSVTVLKLSPRHMFLPRLADIVRVFGDFKAAFRANKFS
ncbi:oligosaccharide flippase family protein [Novosphingobium sp. Chol11]|uniref:lipopolysaccharide biosynthesis protein n=1 Tax=Novosphingobium sp. Chol11 TaxID=1385763 RepID=UPI0025FD3443|nr:oligosaccharide flippase family protein [Novosphingobium sp. Chol11]